LGWKELGQFGRLNYQLKVFKAKEFLLFLVRNFLFFNPGVKKVGI